MSAAVSAGVVVAAVVVFVFAVGRPVLVSIEEVDTRDTTRVILLLLFAFYFFFFFSRTVFSNGYVTRAEQRTCTSSVVPCGGRGRGDGTGCADETDGQTELARNGTAGRGCAWCG